MIKRAMDVSLSLVILLLISPFFFIIPLLIKLDSTGSVLFSQQRVGLNRTNYDMYKFRTMVVGSDLIGSYSTAKADPRITRVGKILRKTSLDEIPQLFNVLKGEMSLVGPRPDVPMQESNYTEVEWIKRCQVRPGITGLAQATKRSEATPQERIQLDLEYVDKASIYFDIKIMLMTVKQLLSTGSY